MITFMLELTPLERTALDAILNELAEDRSMIDQQLANAVVLSRENSGGGFFTGLAGAFFLTAGGGSQNGVGSSAARAAEASSSKSQGPRLTGTPAARSPWRTKASRSA